LSGAYFGGKNNCGINNIYQNAPYGVSIPFIQNAMPRDAFDFMRRYIHFVNNRDRRILDTVMDGLRRAWIAGEKITIDESMIKYCWGRLELRTIYAEEAYKAWDQSIQIYTACKTVDQTAIAIVRRLITTAGLTSACGRILFTDNRYSNLLRCCTMSMDGDSAGQLHH
jgi:hypothetical protein